MITVVCLNPCIDRTVFVRGLLVGDHNVADHSRADVAGKGINVCQVLKTLGYPSLCVGLDHGDHAMRQKLEEMGVPSVCVDTEGQTRVNLKLMDLTDGSMTEINERGAQADPQVVQALMREIDRLLPDTEVLVLSGSVPPGVPASIYADIIRNARTRGAYTILDAGGALLKEGLEAGPDLIKPNTLELETLIGRRIRDTEDALEVCRRIVARGTSVCLSMGADGAWLLTPEGTWFSAGIDIEVKSRQGAGDSLVAGLCCALQRKAAPAEALRTAVAAAHGSLLLEGTQLCTLEDFERLYPQISVNKVM